MGFRIDYALLGRLLRASVRGRSASVYAHWIAREIAAEARRKSARHLLIDVRGLHNRLGILGDLVLGDWGDRRVALLDSGDHGHYHPFPEAAARRRGHDVRYFCDPASALQWLQRE